ncbi:zinc finger protein 385B-like isoform X2 [Eleginops maclovinus]|uniref:zinc finger protein 385B-like isoform X2 n=1 Tax=Eleginops maclovinus TaxID=56733 RepID=UPI0030809355
MENGNGGAVKHTDMKRPKTPDPLDSSAPPRSQDGQEEEDDEEEETKVASVHRAKRERRQGSSSATMCQVCNIQLNSSAQAQIHYRGKTHQRRLRRLAKAVTTGALSQTQLHPLLGSLHLPGRPLQPRPHAQLEHFLPLRVNSSSPLSLFPNFTAMDPVQKAVINHTFGMAPPKKKPIISCNICHLRFNSTTQAEAHYKGHKHARKLKALETQRNRQKNGQGPSTTGKDRDREKGMMGGGAQPTDSNLKDKTGPSTSSQPAEQQPETITDSSLVPTLSPQPLPTDLSSLGSPQLSQQICPDSQLPDLPSDSPPVEGCSPASGSASQTDPQASSTGGSKHKQMLDGHKSNQTQRRIRMPSSPRPTSHIKQRMGSKPRALVGVSSQPFHCEMCHVSVNSETQLKQHMSSRRHKERLAGKPVKAKFTPYNKLQPSAILATKLALQKHFSKALPAGFLTNHLNQAALCSLASGPLGLRLPQGPPAIIHGPLISPTLFRPAPGPLRATHAPIIFSPY